jgi:UDP-3-O-[3-hydroxymyristoyl] glucosamine N-acyltransferase
VAPGKSIFGYPAREAKTAMREAAAVSRLPDLLKRVRAIEKKLAED